MKTAEEKKLVQAECQRRWYERNKEITVARAKEWRMRHPEKYAEAKQRSYRKNRAARLSKQKADYEANKPKFFQRTNSWRQRNVEKARKISVRAALKRREDPLCNLQMRTIRRIAALIRHAFRGQKTSRTIEQFVGWTLDELRSHIERQFTPGMSWERLCSGEIHIDHIVPLKVFTITGPDCPELKRAWALTNLRPLWAIDNLRKGDKRLFLI